MFQQTAVASKERAFFDNTSKPKEIISDLHSNHTGSKLAPPNWLGFLQNKLADENFHQKVIRAHALHTFDNKSANPYYNFTPPKDPNTVNGFSFIQLMYHLQTLKPNECIVKVFYVDYDNMMKYIACVFIVELDSACTSKAITVDTKLSKLRQKQFINRSVNKCLMLSDYTREYQKKWLKEKYAQN